MQNAWRVGAVCLLMLILWAFVSGCSSANSISSGYRESEFVIDQEDAFWR